jgi:hypothetical protein
MPCCQQLGHHRSLRPPIRLHNMHSVIHSIAAPAPVPGPGVLG